MGILMSPLSRPVSQVQAPTACKLDRTDLAKQVSFIYEPRKLPLVLSPQEFARLLEAAPGIKYKAALSVAYGCRAARLRGRLVGPTGTSEGLRNADFCGWFYLRLSTSTKQREWSHLR